MAQVPGALTQMVDIFLVFTYIWQEIVAKITQVPKAPRTTQSQSGPDNTWLVGVTINAAFIKNNSPPPRQFLRIKIVLNKGREKCL